MKISPVMLVVSFAISGLVAYGFYTANHGEASFWLITVGSGILCFTALSGILAVGFDVRGGTGNYRIVSALFLIISLISNVIFNFLSYTVASYIIVNGILFLLYIVIEYAIIKAIK
jgi:integral membrane sensor domain MASE1